MDNTQYIMLPYDKYCELDNELTNLFLNTMDDLINTHIYNDHIIHCSFNLINADDTSFVSFDDQKHTISIYFATKGISQLETRTGIHAVPQLQCAVFCRLPK